MLLTLARAHDEPVVNTAPLNVLFISRAARRNGIKVLLSGAAGDDLFTGYRRHLAVRYEQMWRWLPRTMLSKIENVTSMADQRNPVFRRVAKLFSGSSLDGDARIAHYMLWGKEPQIRRLYTRNFLAQCGAESAMQPLVEFLAGLPRGISPLARMLALEQRFFWQTLI